MGSLLSLLRTHWDHEPDWHPSPCPLSARRGEGGRRPGEGRFMESPAAVFGAHWGHEPGIPLTRPPATLPSDGEREEVRGRFMESPLSFFRMHWAHEPD